MRTEGRPDMTKLVVAFRNFANVHTNGFFTLRTTDRSLDYKNLSEKEIINVRRSYKVYFIFVRFYP